MKKTRLTTNWRYLPLLIIMLLSSKVVLSMGNPVYGSLTPTQMIQTELLASQLGLKSGELIGVKEIQVPTFKESLPRKLDTKPSKIERLIRINNSGIGIVEEFTAEKPLKQFGYDLFSTTPLTFAPVTDAPIPSDYILGPGDTINILFFGKKSAEISQQVTRDGNTNDLSLKHGDSLSIPTQPQQVTVIGEVNYSTSHLFDPALTLEQYIGRSGGAKKNADINQIYVIKASGSVMTAGNERNTFFRMSGKQSLISAGDTIVVPIDTERASPMEVWTSVTQITSQIAITLASFKTLGLF